jgi:hypothetical protein
MQLRLIASRFLKVSWHTDYHMCPACGNQEVRCHQQKTNQYWPGTAVRRPCLAQCLIAEFLRLAFQCRPHNPCCCGTDNHILGRQHGHTNLHPMRKLPPLLQLALFAEASTFFLPILLENDVRINHDVRNCISIFLKSKEVQERICRFLTGQSERLNSQSLYFGMDVIVTRSLIKNDL